MSNIFELIGTLITGIIIPIVAYFIDKKRKELKQNKKDKIREETEFSVVLDRKIDLIRDKYKADRVWICQFHNGGHFYPTGRSIQKFSMFYESVSQYTYSIKFQYQNIPINLFSKSINELLNKNIIAISDLENPNIDNFGLINITEKNTSSLYITAIRNIEGRFIGMLGMSFTKKTELSREELTEFIIEASRMGGEVAKHLKNT